MCSQVKKEEECSLEADSAAQSYPALQPRHSEGDAPLDPEWPDRLDFLLEGGWQEMAQPCLPDGAFGLEWPGQLDFLLEGC